MMPSDWDALRKEAYMHGRTQEQFSVAVEALRRIVEVCQRSTRLTGYRLLEVGTIAEATLRQLSSLNGGVIDDVGVPK